MNKKYFKEQYFTWIDISLGVEVKCNKIHINHLKNPVVRIEDMMAEGDPHMAEAVPMWEQFEPFDQFFHCDIITLKTKTQPEKR